MNARILGALGVAALLAVACDEPVVGSDGGVDGGQASEPDAGPPDAAQDAGGGPRCGDGVTQAPELCDGDCPTSCDDSVACTADVLTGSAEDCGATCSFTPITACAGGDGCCPGGCGPDARGVGPQTCGDGVVGPADDCGGGVPTSRY